MRDGGNWLGHNLASRGLSEDGQPPFFFVVRSVDVIFDNAFCLLSA